LPRIASSVSRSLDVGSIIHGFFLGMLPSIEGMMLPSGDWGDGVMLTLSRG
jgi:hypothetical protein